MLARKYTEQKKCPYSSNRRWEVIPTSVAPSHDGRLVFPCYHFTFHSCCPPSELSLLQTRPFPHLSHPLRDSLRSVTPNSYHTHREPRPSNQSPHEFQVLLIPRALLNLLSIHLSHFILDNSRLQSLVHRQIQRSARCGYDRSPDEIRVLDPRRGKRESCDQRDRGNGRESSDMKC